MARARRRHVVLQSARQTRALTMLSSVRTVFKQLLVLTCGVDPSGALLPPFTVINGYADCLIMKCWARVGPAHKVEVQI